MKHNNGILSYWVVTKFILSDLLSHLYSRRWYYIGIITEHKSEPERFSILRVYRQSGAGRGDYEFDINQLIGCVRGDSG